MSTNDITGDDIKTKSNSTEYVNNWERIFGKVPISDFFSEDSIRVARVFKKGGEYLVDYNATETFFKSQSEAEDFAESLVLCQS